ncbi:hypothetical protein P7F88_25510 [Vibrio hannami]|uniref:hypothetical protein n=1 Tax=Vibrio hannami TaxID=2717094 RepID=UPI00240F096E|nr:hypothetical protein [Vibrio hannami]MDG3089224.1 hypothetical protein [Vibrio hannami]
MCTGLELAAIGASTAGSLYNNKIQNDAIGEQNRQNQIALEMQQANREAEAERQAQMELEQANAVTQALFEADPTKVAEKAKAEATDPGNLITQAVEEYAAPKLEAQVANADVDADIGATIAGEMKRTRKILDAAALLSAQGTTLSGVQDALGRMSSQVQTTGSNRRGSINASRSETSIQPATVTASSSPIGDILMLSGSLGAGMAGKAAGKAGVGRFGLGDIFAPRLSGVGGAGGGTLTQLFLA